MGRADEDGDAAVKLSLESLAGAFCGLVAVLGLILAIAGLMRRPAPASRRRGPLERKARTLLGLDNPDSRRAWWAQDRTRVLGSLVVGIAVWPITGWLLGAVLVTVALLGLPWMLQPGKGAKNQIVRLEALEEWVRRLSSIHTAGASLESAVTASLRTVPKPIQEPVTHLSSRLKSGWPAARAYEAFADDLDDATADQVAALFKLHAQDRGSGLSTALEALAGSVAEQVRMRRQVEADRAKPRTNARWVTAFCLLIFGLAVMSGSYTEPYSSVMGQLVLVLLAVCFVGALLWMRSMAASRPTPRFLTGVDRTGSGEDS
ncbi:type II secretion system F family protein [Kitasatospora sp. MBT66]|uniref:type II secretion system F family protein n=1 Tax=Kitasatospora sp. MBT66 TaxID=1444769 RepID=UPI001E2ACD2D|nr:type II secretion system F family protein [Kitasatospora sp. MBT66]